MRSYAMLAEHNIFNLTVVGDIELKFHGPPHKKMGILFCLRQVKTIFNLMICWELRLKPGLEYRTIRLFEDKLSCQL